MKRPVSLLHVLPILLLAGCGGSSHSSSTHPPTSSSAASSPAPSTTTTTHEQTTTSGGQTATGGIQTTTASKPLPKPTHVRLPATFTISSDGVLNPPVIAVPAGLPVQLTVVSDQAVPHQVVLESSPPRHLKVPARGRVTALLGKLPKKTYKLLVDGRPKGSLSIGVQVGP